jgi:hypothetical protein
VLGALALAGPAGACVCVDASVEERLDDADAAVVGTVRGFTRPDSEVPVRVLTLDVETRVKGEVPTQDQDSDVRRIFVRTPLNTDCDVTVEAGTTIGLLLTKQPGGAWYATACSVVPAGQLVTEGGEPRGGPIKVAIGAVILGLVLLWALLRRRRGSRPNLPGAPQA